MIKWWRNLSVSRKLYSVVGLMAVLIALELFTLLFAMRTLSAVRAFVNGEGAWSKAQKNAVQSLYLYVVYQDDKYYKEFHKHLRVPKGDRIARHELLKTDFNYDIVRAGFIQGDNHPNDIDAMINLLQRFHNISYIHDAIVAWSAADVLMDELIQVAEEIHTGIAANSLNSMQLRKSMERVSAINTKISQLENTFSESLGAGSRWLEQLLMSVLLMTVLTVEVTGLLLTFRFGKNLNSSLNELMETAKAVGQGNFTQVAPVHSEDELGHAAKTSAQVLRNSSSHGGAKASFAKILAWLASPR